jgi:acyl carrier protein
MQTPKPEIREFIINNFLFGEGGDKLKDDESFLDSGIVDSTGVLELVGFLEERFKIAVDSNELLPENLDSVERVSAFVQRKLHG